MNTTDRAAIEAMVGKLEAAWNAGDGELFSEPFAEDADFVNIRAEHMQGRDVIAEGHAAIFRTIYAGSTTALIIESLRLLRPDVALLHVKSVLDAPTGPMQGRHTARFSAVLTRVERGWQIASFHNTVAPPPRPA